MPGTPVISAPEIRKRIDAEAAKHGPFSLLIVDTSAAYFRGEDENDNVQLGQHARNLRTFVDLPGGPTVIVTTHPVKTPGMDNLIPRGGGAFLNEVDGNLVAIKQQGSSVVDLHWHGKIRGPDFAPIAFEIVSGTNELLKDSKGRQIFTVIARPLTDAERDTADQGVRGDQDALLQSMHEHPGLSFAGHASRLFWLYKNGQPDKTKVSRLMFALKADKLVKKERGKWVLTPAGEKAQAAQKGPPKN